jgi:hypothetical protein
MVAKKRTPARMHPSPELTKMDKEIAGAQQAIVEDAAAIYAKPFQRVFGKAVKQVAKPGAHPPEYLVRHLAALYYATDPNGCSLAELRKFPLFVNVSGHSLRAWSTEDHWTERRAEYWRMADELVIRRVAEELTQGRMHQLRKLEIVWENGINKLINNLVPAGSWEGVANAIRMLSSEIDGLRMKIAESQAITPPSIGLAPTAAMLDVSDDEAREAALFLLEKRQHRQQQALEAAKDVTGDSDAKAPKAG